MSKLPEFTRQLARATERNGRAAVENARNYLADVEALRPETPAEYKTHADVLARAQVQLAKNVQGLQLAQLILDVFDKEVQK